MGIMVELEREMEDREKNEVKGASRSEGSRVATASSK